VLFLVFGVDSIAEGVGHARVEPRSLRL